MVYGQYGNEKGQANKCIAEAQHDWLIPSDKWSFFTLYNVSASPHPSESCCIPPKHNNSPPATSYMPQITRPLLRHLYNRRGGGQAGVPCHSFPWIPRAQQVAFLRSCLQTVGMYSAAEGEGEKHMCQEGLCPACNYSL